MINQDYIKYNEEMDRLSDKTKALLAKAVVSTKEFVEHTKELSETNYYTRGAHAKSYAYLKGIFTPNPSVVSMLDVENHFAEQSILLRFSNANNVIVDESKNFPTYGMSLKFGNAINYPLVNFPLFPTDDVDAFLRLFIDLNQARISQAKNGWAAIKELPSLVSSALNMSYHVNPLRLGNIMWKGIKLKNKFLFDYAYYGIGCYRFGDYVGKISTAPSNFNLDDLEMKNFVQFELIEKILENSEIEFNIYVQLAIDSEKTPINILSKEWNEDDSPKQVLGTINIPRQSPNLFDESLENTSFNPFLNPKILQPVGRIQQIRKDVYNISSTTRNQLNKV